MLVALLGCAALIGCAPSQSEEPLAPGERARLRVLMVTTTHGYRHEPAIRKAREEMKALAQSTELTFDVTEDLEALTEENLARYDVLFLNNATLRDSVVEAQAPKTKDAIKGFTQAGNGLVLAHAALDAFYDWPAYRSMAGGGLFQEHPWIQMVRVRIERPENPTVSHFGEGFRIRDEIYVLDENPRPNACVLASLDTSSVEVDPASEVQTRGDYPISWIRRTEGGGRVFVTKLGHFPEVWSTPGFRKHLLQGIRLAAGRLEANFSPRC